MIDRLMELAQNQLFTALAGASVVGGLVYWAREVPARLWLGLRYLVTYELEVSNDTGAYAPTLTWLTQALNAHWYNRRFKIVDEADLQDRCGPPRAVGSGDETRRRRDWLLSPAPGAHWCRFEGWPLRVEREITNETHAAYSSVREVLRLRLYSPNWSRFERLAQAIRLQLDEKATLAIYIYTVHGWQLFERRRPRPAASVVTPGDLLGRILADARSFLAAEEWYVDRGVPYRRGYLFKGVPGTGKTSVAMCIAGALELPLYVLNLGGIAGDASLIEAISGVPGRSILLLEDFDTSAPGRAADGSSSGLRVTFAGLLNVLDGALSRDGRLLIVTANDADRLDRALVRPGRIDAVFDFPLSGAREAAELFDRFFAGSEYGPALASNGFDARSAADIQAALLLHRNDAAAAYRELLGAPRL